MLKRFISSQKGGFSPFMFGMLMSVGAISALAQHWAKQDMISMEERQLNREKQRVSEIRQAMENSILLETAATYDANLTDVSNNLQMRIMQNANSVASGRTRDETDFSVAVVDTTAEFDPASDGINKKIVIGATDDDFVKNELGNIVDTTDIANLNLSSTQAIAVFDTSAVRKKQIDRSKEYMQIMIGGIFDYYATAPGGNFRFPDTTEYGADIAGPIGATDVWGGAFTYERSDDYDSPACVPDCDQKGRISFTTPWGYTYYEYLDMTTEP